jgi:hypothetical protein
MRILIAIIVIFGASFVLLMGLLSVVRDLLVITTRHAQSELDSRAVGREGAALCAKARKTFND